MGYAKFYWPVYKVPRIVIKLHHIHDRDVPPPRPIQDNVTTVHHGYKRIDEYKWIEDINNRVSILMTEMNAKVK